MQLELAELFEKVAQQIDPQLAAKWLRKELLRVLNYNNISAAEIKFNERELVELLQLIQHNRISDATAQKIIEELMVKPFSPKEYVAKHHLELISDDKELREFCHRVIAENKAAVNDYQTGNEKSLNFLVGLVMRLSKGKASPQIVNELMKKLIK